MHFIIIALAALLWERRALAEETYSGLTGDRQFYQVHTPPCTLDLVPSYSEQFKSTPLHICVQAFGSAQTILPLKPKKLLPIRSATEGNLDLGFFWGPNHAVHVESRLRIQNKQRFSRRPEKPNFDHHKATLITAAYAFKKPKLDRWGLLLGKQRAPFGVNASIRHPDLFSWTLDHLWPAPNWGAKIHYGNRDNALLELGAFRPLNTPMKHSNDQLQPLKEEFDTSAVSARFIFDTSAWHGTRMICSGHAQSGGEKRLGFALLNFGLEQSSSHFEWVRVWGHEHHDPKRYKQIFRVQVEGPRRRSNVYAGESQSSFSYDDVRAFARIATLSQSYFFSTNFVLRASLTYRKDEIARNYAWYTALNAEASL